MSVDSATNQPVIILRPAEEPDGEGRLVPIWIGHTEATAILLALQSISPPRPMTHDLLNNVISHLGVALSRVEITHIVDGTFFANLVLEGADGTQWRVDARPSDSIALAVRAGATILLSEQVLDEAAIVEVTEEDTEAEVERFREFLDHVDPTDFQS